MRWYQTLLILMMGVCGLCTLYYSDLVMSRIFSPGQNGAPRVQTCATEQRQIAFIKIHKAGSSTIANILFRFGMARNLTFLIPKDTVTITDSLERRWTNIMPAPKPSQHYDILSNHAVYNPREIYRLMPKQTVLLAIVRHPMTQLISGMYYYYPNMVPGENKIQKYITNYTAYGKLYEKRNYINNSMSYELGLPREQFFNSTYIRSHLLRLDKELDLVLIMERMDESLVLLRRLFCWPLKDIIFITRNVNKKKPEIILTDVDRNRHRQISQADYMMYEFFSNKFEKAVSQQAQDFQNEVAVFKRLRRKVSEFCEAYAASDNLLTLEKTAWSEEFWIYPKDCNIMLLNGIQILGYVQNWQYSTRH